MSAMGGNPLSRSVHRPVKTCTECKQVKLRCDSKAKFPAPCTRCQARNLQCVVDSTFRRTPARKRVEEMARELEVLRSQREENGHHKSTLSPSLPDTTFDSPEYTLEQSGTAVLNDEKMKDQYRLGTCVVDRESIIEIFRIFALLFYPHFPVLNPNIEIEEMHNKASFLFWSIVAMVTSHEIAPQHAALFEQMREPFLEKLRSDILSAPLPLQTVQALTYLIMWPFPAERQNRDPSWVYCGAAVNAAMYMGLHHSKPMQSLRSIGVHTGSLRARANTWLGCFLASVSVGMHVGVSPSINSTTDLATIEQFVRTYPIPPEFAYQVMVQHTLAKFTTVVLENSQEVVSHSLVKLIDTELDGLKTRFPTPWTPRVEMAVLIAKIHLYTMTIIRIQLDLTSREILMKNGFSVALRIVYLSDQGLGYRPTEYSDLPPEVLQRAIPKNYFRALVLATIFLLRFFVLNIHATPEEQEVARNHVAMAQRYLKAGALGNSDERARGAYLLQMLSRQQPVDVDNKKLRIDDRMGASIVYDAITIGHELRNLPAEVDESGADTGDASQNVEKQNVDQPMSDPPHQPQHPHQQHQQHHLQQPSQPQPQPHPHLQHPQQPQPQQQQLPLPPPPHPHANHNAPPPLAHAHLNQVTEADMHALNAQHMAGVPVAPMVGVSGMSMDGLGVVGGQLDFSLPEDLWGDSVWGMFGAFAPSQMQG